MKRIWQKRQEKSRLAAHDDDDKTDRKACSSTPPKQLPLVRTASPSSGVLGGPAVGRRLALVKTQADAQQEHQVGTITAYYPKTGKHYVTFDSDKDGLPPPPPPENILTEDKHLMLLDSPQVNFYWLSQPSTTSSPTAATGITVAAKSSTDPRKGVLPPLSDLERAIQRDAEGRRLELFHKVRKTWCRQGTIIRYAEHCHQHVVEITEAQRDDDEGSISSSVDTEDETVQQQQKQHVVVQLVDLAATKWRFTDLRGPQREDKAQTLGTSKYIGVVRYTASAWKCHYTPPPVLVEVPVPAPKASRRSGIGARRKQSKKKKVPSPSPPKMRQVLQPQPEIYIGCFSTEKDAALAYDLWARRDQAPVNFTDRRICRAVLEHLKIPEPPLPKPSPVEEVVAPSTAAGTEKVISVDAAKETVVAEEVTAVTASLEVAIAEISSLTKAAVSTKSNDKAKPAVVESIPAEKPTKVTKETATTELSEKETPSAAESIPAEKPTSEAKKVATTELSEKEAPAVAKSVSTKEVLVTKSTKETASSPDSPVRSVSVSSSESTNEVKQKEAPDRDSDSNAKSPPEPRRTATPCLLESEDKTTKSAPEDTLLETGETTTKTAAEKSLPSDNFNLKSPGSINAGVDSHSREMPVEITSSYTLVDATTNTNAVRRKSSIPARRADVVGSASRRKQSAAWRDTPPDPIRVNLTVVGNSDQTDAMSMAAEPQKGNTASKASKTGKKITLGGKPCEKQKKAGVSSSDINGANESDKTPGIGCAPWESIASNGEVGVVNPDILLSQLADMDDSDESACNNVTASTGGVDVPTTITTESSRKETKKQSTKKNDEENSTLTTTVDVLSSSDESGEPKLLLLKNPKSRSRSRSLKKRENHVPENIFYSTSDEETESPQKKKLVKQKTKELSSETDGKKPAKKKTPAKNRKSPEKEVQGEELLSEKEEMPLAKKCAKKKAQANPIAKEPVKKKAQAKELACEKEEVPEVKESTENKPGKSKTAPAKSFSSSKGDLDVSKKTGHALGKTQPGKKSTRVRQREDDGIISDDEAEAPRVRKPKGTKKGKLSREKQSEKKGSKARQIGPNEEILSGDASDVPKTEKPKHKKKKSRLPKYPIGTQFIKVSDGRCACIS